MAGRRGGRGNVGARKQYALDVSMPWAMEYEKEEEVEALRSPYDAGFSDRQASPAVVNYKGSGMNVPANAYVTSPENDQLIREKKWNIEPFSWYKGNYGKENTEGMISGVLDKVKGLGKHLAENNPVSLRFDEVRANVEAYDSYWLERLQHPGAPTREDYGNEVDFDNDYEKYWTDRPLDYEYFSK